MMFHIRRGLYARAFHRNPDSLVARCILWLRGWRPTHPHHFSRGNHAQRALDRA